MEANTSDWVLFMGRFHPLILHVPIGFLTLAFILECLSRFRRFQHFAGPVEFTLVLGTATALIASILGLMLAQGGGYNDDLLVTHQWAGILVCVLGLSALALKRFSKKNVSVKIDRLYLIAMLSMMLTITVAGHYGGSLTHGSDYLTRYMPDGLRAITGISAEPSYEMKVITNLDSAVVYTDIIDPILHMHCTSCHNDDKRKGDLMMHTPDDLLKGGESGELFIPGDAARSLMIERILLPQDHEDHMPPQGKRELTDEQVALLKWWVDEGAPFDKRVSHVNVPGEVKAILTKLVEPGAGQSEVEKLLASKADPVNEQALLQFQTKGISIEPLSAEIHWLQADVAPFVAADSLLEMLTPLSAEITWLSLAATSTTDNGLANVANFRHLTRLHIGNTAITDGGMKHLQDLAYLESLNLYGTRISDKGLQYLSHLKNLRKLYVWKTNVTSEGVAALKKVLPQLEVNVGSEVGSK